jgi:hypothetical protein
MKSEPFRVGKDTWRRKTHPPGSPDSSVEATLSQQADLERRRAVRVEIVLVQMGGFARP